MEVRYFFLGKINKRDNQTLIDKLKFISEYISSFSLKHGISGIFYYANQQFFHCIEGNIKDINNLLLDLDSSMILSKNIKFKNTNIQERIFRTWKMKYISYESEIISFFKDLGYDNFIPLSLEENDLNSLSEIIINQRYKKEAKKKAVGYKNRGNCFY